MSERWRLLVHLMRKDWRLIWPFAVLCWCSVLVRWVTPDIGGERWPLRWSLANLLWILPLLAQARLFHADPVLGTTQLWISRPIPRLTLLAAKLTLYVTVIIVPCVVLEVAPLVLTDLRLSAGDYAMATLGVGLFYTLFVAAAFPAALTRSLTGLVFLYATAGTSLTLLLAQANQWWMLQQGFIPWAGEIASRSALGGVLTTLAALVVLGILYRTRRARRAVVVAVVLLVAAHVITRIWHVDFTASADPLLRTEPVAVRPAPDGWRGVSLSIEDASVRWPTWSGREEGRLVIESHLYVAARPRGLPAGLALVEIGYSAVAEAVAGGTVRSERDVRGLASFDVPVRGSHWLPSAISVIGGCSEEGAGTIDVFRIDHSLASGRPALRNVHGRVRFAVVRPFVLDRAPARPGQVLSWPRRHIIITGITDDGARSELQLRDAQLVVPKLGQPSTLPSAFVFDPSDKGCYTSSFDMGLGSWRGLTYAARDISADDWIGPRRPSRASASQPEAPFPANWLASTELVFVSAEPLGTIELPFELPLAD